MNSTGGILLTAGFIAASLAAAIHVYIFVLESVLWVRPSTRRIFGITTDAEAAHTRPLAFNQGFYNLFLAIAVVIGIPLSSALFPAGIALVLAGTVSMVLAALVLVLSRRELIRSAAIQGVLPLIAVILISIGLLTATDTTSARADGSTALTTDAPVAGLPAGVQDETLADFAVVVDDTRIIVVTYGSSSCPRAPAGYDARSPSPFRLVSEPTSTTEACTADYAPTSTGITLPDGIDPVTAVELDGTPLPIVTG